MIYHCVEFSFIKIQFLLLSPFIKTKWHQAFYCINTFPCKLNLSLMLVVLFFATEHKHKISNHAGMQFGCLLIRLLNYILNCSIYQIVKVHRCAIRTPGSINIRPAHLLTLFEIIVRCRFSRR